MSKHGDGIDRGPCGSELARDGGASETSMLTDTPLSRASFAPTELMVYDCESQAASRATSLPQAGL
ncbi:hypothetical protein EMIT043CA1_30202 [Pseudomonas brassicacearum]